MTRAIEALAERRLIVCVGPGGVGKTTLAAALALALARRGRRVLVLTVDPARRLAGVLRHGARADAPEAVGDMPLGDAIQRVPIENAELWAAMVGTADSYDAWIERLVPSAVRRQEIFDNRVYRAFSRTLARSHAYIAMERVFDAVTSDRFDVVVLDTPPMRSALEVLDAPGRLASFLEDDVVQWFLSVPDATAGSVPRQLLARGGSAALALLSLATGPSLVQEMVGFFRLFASLRPDLEARARFVRGLFQDEATGFVLVASPDANHIDDASAMRDGLAERAIDLAAVLVNRAYIPEARGHDDRAGAELPAPVAPRPEAHRADERARDDLARRLAALRTALAADNDRRRAAAESLVCDLSPRPPLVLLPELDPDQESWERLARLLAQRSSVG